jgi:hypothetical protein
VPPLKELNAEVGVGFVVPKLRPDIVTYDEMLDAELYGL